MTKKEKIFISDERKTFDLQAVSRTIMPLAKAMLGKKGFVEVDLIANWGDIAGQELAAYSVPQRLEFRRGEKNNGILHVAVPGGAFALELQHREKIIIGKVNAFFGYNAVAALKIMQNADIPVKDAENVKTSQKTLVSEAEENYIKDLSGGVQNSALQEVLQRLGRSVISNNKGENKKNED